MDSAGPMRAPSLLLLVSVLLSANGLNACSDEASTSNEKAPEEKALDVEGTTEAVLARSYCGLSTANCGGRGSVAVDLKGSAVTRKTCVEVPEVPADADAGVRPTPATTRFDETTRLLTTEELARVREALGKVRYARATSTEQDGAMLTLDVTTPSGTLSLKDTVRCGNPEFDKIVAGYSELTAAFDAL